MNITETFRQWLETEPGPWKVGQVLIESLPGRSGLYSLGATDGMGDGSAEVFSDLFKVRQWIKLDAAGKFRPLKGEKNLCGGWKIEPLDVAQLKEAFDIIYPTAVANWLGWREGNLRVTPFAETVGRQTGMYRVTGLTTEAQREAVKAELCVARCLKKRLWEGEPVGGGGSEIPLLCPEICNLFVASCRAKIKGKTEEE